MTNLPEGLRYMATGNGGVQRALSNYRTIYTQTESMPPPAAELQIINVSFDNVSNHSVIVMAAPAIPTPTTSAWDTASIMAALLGAWVMHRVGHQ